jgi:hypothetical protein
MNHLSATLDWDYAYFATRNPNTCKNDQQQQQQLCYLIPIRITVVHTGDDSPQSSCNIGYIGNLYVYGAGFKQFFLGGRDRKKET